MSHQSLRRALALLFVLTLVAAACGSDDDSADAENDGTSADGEASVSDDGAVDGGGSTGGGSAAGTVEGEIVISGSSTVEPISVAVAEGYKALQPDVNISVAGPGTGDGFKGFCAGETDISDASRQIKDSEAEDCAVNGIEYVELKVAVDGIAVMTNADNADIECLSFPDLYAIVGPEAIGINNWSELNELASDVGGNGGFPDAELVISAPGTESGTYDSFVEIVLEDLAEDRAQPDPQPRPDYSSAADDNIIIETISSNPGSFGWVGFAFAAEASNVKLIEISEEAGGTCVSPTPETIASNEYPIARDLFIYVNAGRAGPGSALADFVDYYMDFGLDRASADVGYVPLTEESKEATRTAWTSR